LGFVDLHPFVTYCHAYHQHLVYLLPDIYIHRYRTRALHETQARTYNMSNADNSNSLNKKLGGNGLYWLSQMTRKTCEFHINPLDRIQNILKGDQPVIFAGWHGMTMMFVPMIQHFHPKMSSFVVLMPDDWRGETLRIWTEKMGAVPYPMNLYGDTTLGMARQLLQLIRQIKGGKHLYITPDGPDGPAHFIKPGVAFIARKSNAIIVPFGAYCRHAYILPRWDRYTIPLPFSRIYYHIGTPIQALPEDNDIANHLLTHTLNAVTLQAAADYYERN
jgi:lysophospholipid acyltransferase (LPLAT)-like uncharacterized protein